MTQRQIRGTGVPVLTRPSPTTVRTIGRRSMVPSKIKQSTPDKKVEAAKEPAKKASPTAAKSSTAKKTSSAEGTSAKKASAGKGASGKKVNPALMKPLQPSKELAAVVGSDPLPRPGGGEQSVGLHQVLQPPEPAEQARDQ